MYLFEKALCEEGDIVRASSQRWNSQIDDREESIKIYTKETLSYHLHQVTARRCYDSYRNTNCFRPISWNDLFAGSNAGSERAAAIYSLLGSAKLNGLDPEIYLHHVIERIADHPIGRIKDLLPWNVSPTPVATPPRCVST